jgi:hypothetical protein
MDEPRTASPSAWASRAAPHAQSAVEALLGPKTEADLAPAEPVKKKKEPKAAPPPAAQPSAAAEVRCAWACLL